MNEDNKAGCVVVLFFVVIVMMLVLSWVVINAI